MNVLRDELKLVSSFDKAKFRHGLIGKNQIRQVKTSMIVNQKTVMLHINEKIRQVLGLEIIDHRPSELAAEKRRLMPVAGPIEVWFENRICTTNAFVLPGEQEPILGKIPMSEMDLWISPARNLLTPVHPEGPVMSLK